MISHLNLLSLLLLLNPNHLVNLVKTIPWTSIENHETKNGTLSAINEQGGINVRGRGNKETETERTWTLFAQWLLLDNNSNNSNRIGLPYLSTIGVSTSVFLLKA